MFGLRAFRSWRALEDKALRSRPQEQGSKAEGFKFEASAPKASAARCEDDDAG